MNFKKTKLTIKVLCIALCCTMLLPMLFSCSDSSNPNDSETLPTDSSSNGTQNITQKEYLDVIIPEFDFTGTDLLQYLTLPTDISTHDYREGLDLLGEPTEKDIKTQLNVILKNYATKTEPADAVVEDGDSVIMDFVGKRDGVEFSGGSATGTEHEISIDNSTYIEGFDKGMIGMKVGETRDLNLTFPDPYPNNASLAGAAVVFTVTVKKIIRYEYPELTDQFMQDNKDDFDDSIKTAQDLIDAITEDLTASYKQNDEELILDASWAYVVDNTEVKGYPDGLLEGYKQACYASYYNKALQSNMTLEQYAQSQNYLDEKAFVSGVIDKEAENVLKETMTLYAVAQFLEINVTEEDAKAYAQDEFDEYIAPSLSYYQAYLGISNVDDMIRYMGGIEVYQEKVTFLTIVYTITGIEMPEIGNKEDTSETN